MKSIVLNPGDNIYKFTLIRKLGGGNFGEVWLSKDNTLNKQIALKILDATFEPVVKILEESRIGNRFDHRNLLKIYYADVTKYKGITLTLIAQKYLVNGTVTNLLNPGNFIPLPEVLRITKDVLFGLEHLHNQGFYHNDIKPTNILLGKHNEGVLADYGLTMFSPNGTPITPKNAYKIHRAPETFGTSPQISILTDIYQVGCTAYRLLNGISEIKNEFFALGEAEFEKRKAKGKIPNPKNYSPFVPAKIKTIINKSIHPDPSKRFQSALEMRRKLERLSFPGYWDYDARGNLIGYGRNHHYSFKKIPISLDVASLECHKSNIKTGRVTRVSNFCAKRRKEKEINKLIHDFIQWVINGK